MLVWCGVRLGVAPGDRVEPLELSGGGHVVALGQVVQAERRQHGQEEEGVGQAEGGRAEQGRELGRVRGG